MRTVERFAFVFGVVNLVLGALSLFSPFVSHRRNRNPISRFFSRYDRGIINRRPGQLFGFLGAVNPPHSVIHSMLGAAGLATRRYSNMSRAYMWLNGIMFAAMAAIGWATVGMKPGVHKVKGMAVDRNANIIHTLWGLGALLLAVKPTLGQNAFDREISTTISEVSAD